MSTLSSIITGRLAPSPTGLLHLGNAFAFLAAWLACRSRSGRMILRIEDIDPQRSRQQYITAILEDLAWLGLDWDEGPDVGGTNGPYIQSQRADFYHEALQKLTKMGATYPCFCSRKELRELASAPHCEDNSIVYPGTCRNLSFAEQEERRSQGRKAALRVRCPEGSCITFEDAIYGKMRVSAKEWGGDFALKRSDHVVAYQLAAALDDALMGVNQVVRGRDLLLSTPRQLFLLSLLGKQEPQEYVHIPLLLDSERERLAKRHQSVTLASLRAQGVRCERIVGLLSFLLGLNPTCCDVSAHELVHEFSLEALPREDCVLTDSLLLKLRACR